ncbi:MAG TPA: EAL domain-containing protein [Acidimicrobiales bacterium]|nr:EAL domain-containing protein [Acidimicrobiales bacterium]
MVCSSEVSSRRQDDIDVAPLLERAAWVSAEGIALVVDDVLRWANPALHVMCSLAPGELVGRPVGDIDLVELDEEDAATVPARLGPDLADGRPQRLLLRRADGSTVAVSGVTARLQAVPEGAWVLRLREIAARLRADEALRSSEARFRALADHAPIGVFLSDVGVRLAYVNPGFAGVWGRSAHELEGDSWLDPIVDEDRVQVLAAVAGVLAGERADVAFRVLRPDGDVRTLEARFVPLVGVDRQCSFVGSVEDVTDARAREAALAWQARHDALTGLPNRTELWERIHRHVDASERAVSLLFFDLDDFKLVNDSLGHAAGDVLLMEVAERLRTTVRDGDVVARFGGDEFVVFCPGTSTEAEAAHIADRLLAVLREPVDLGSRQVRVTASAGILVSTPEHRDTESLIRDADIAMYQAKTAGKARSALFDAGARRRIEHRLDVVSDLRRALSEGEVGVAYQPIMRPADLTVAGAEALLRYEHPLLGALPADQVIEVAEASGCIDELGAYVLHRACADLVAWRDRADGWRPQYVSVNLAASQLAHPDFEQQVATALAGNGLVPSDLCLELTESQLMTDVATAEEVLGRLSATGVRLAIDDFGTGYSSLAYLRRFPVSLVKIERSFVGDADNPSVAAIIEAVVSVTRALGGAVVAEGVETVEQLDAVVGLGCRLVQGYLVSRPGPADQLPTARQLRMPDPTQTRGTPS